MGTGIMMNVRKPPVRLHQLQQPDTAPGPLLPTWEFRQIRVPFLGGYRGYIRATRIYIGFNV